MKRNLATKIVIGMLALFGLGGIVGGVFAVNMVNDNLTAQKITFGEDSKYAGDQVTNGLEAYRFQGYINGHVQSALKPVGMSTYEEISAAARATVTPQNPTGDAKLMGLRRTALDGQLLRGTLFSSFAWWLVGWVGVAVGIAFLGLSVAAFFATKPKHQEPVFIPAAEMVKTPLTV
jgi:hypothetical protein